MALRPTGECWAVTNGEAGIAALVTRPQAIDPQLIVREATGGYQRAVIAVLAAAGLPIVVVNPRQARDVAKATGQLAKMDVLDARALAHFADAVQPTLRPLPDAQTEELRALLARRRQLIACSRLQSCTHVQARRLAHHPGRSSRYGHVRRAAVGSPSEPLVVRSLPTPRLGLPSESGH
jgi:hypothetical protein